MAIGLRGEEVESIVSQSLKKMERRVGPQLVGNQIRQLRSAIAEVITQNNARILDALTKAGIKL